MQSYQNQNVLFVTTKNLDYLRNTQEIRLIEQTAKSVTVLEAGRRAMPSGCSMCTENSAPCP